MFAYRVRFDLCIWALNFPLLSPFNIDHAIDDCMRYMNTLWTEFSCQRLAERPHSEFACGEA